MTEIETLKVEAANLFYAREQLQINLMQVNQRLQDITTSIQKIEQQKAEENGDPKED